MSDVIMTQSSSAISVIVASNKYWMLEHYVYFNEQRDLKIVWCFCFLFDFIGKKSKLNLNCHNNYTYFLAVHIVHELFL